MARVVEQSSLAEYEWDPKTGHARFVYATRHGFGAAIMHADGPQPAQPSHEGWSEDEHVRAFVDEDRPFPTRDTAPKRSVPTRP